MIQTFCFGFCRHMTTFTILCFVFTATRSSMRWRLFKFFLSEICQVAPKMSSSHKKQKRKSLSGGKKQIDRILKRRQVKTIVPGVLTVAAYANFYPVCYKQNGEYKGIDVDIMQRFCRATGLGLQFVEKDHFDGIWLDPINGSADTSIGGIGVTPLRTTPSTIWTIPYFYVNRTVVFKKTNPIRSFPEGVTGIIHGTVGSTGWIDAKERMTEFGNAHLMIKGKTDEEDIQDLLDGKIQGLMRGSFVGLALTRRHKQLGMVTPWEILPHLVSSDGECFAYPCHANSDVAGPLNAFLTMITLDGTLAKLVKKHKLV